MPYFFGEKYHSTYGGGLKHTLPAGRDEKYKVENIHQKSYQTATISYCIEQSTLRNILGVVGKRRKWKYKTEFAPTAIGRGNN